MTTNVHIEFERLPALFLRFFRLQVRQGGRSGLCFFYPPVGTRVTLTNNLGCSSQQVFYPWGGAPTATQAARELAAAATLHPNPAAARATLTLAQAPAGVVRITVLNALGQVVGTYAATGGGRLTQPLELGGLAAGVYAVRVSTSAGSFAKRLVVE